MYGGRIMIHPCAVLDFDSPFVRAVERHGKTALEKPLSFDVVMEETARAEKVLSVVAAGKHRNGIVRRYNQDTVELNPGNGY